MSGPMRVLLTTEGTYPFHQGGVSTWCESLISQMETVEFVVFGVVGQPFLEPMFTLPIHAQLQTVPLWQFDDANEQAELPVMEHFISLFRQVVEEISAETKNPHRFGQLLGDLYDYFQEHNYAASLRSKQAWDVYQAVLLQAAADQKGGMRQPDTDELRQSYGWFYRFFSILTAPIPRTDLTHATAAGFCGIPCVIAKVKANTPYVLTEHGVYLREQYLALANHPYSAFLKTFLLRFVTSIVMVNYAFADQVSPVCAYNTRWETRLGVPIERIQVIPNGVDPKVFEVATEQGEGQHLTVVMMARIDPLKDILTFLRAAALVVERMPQVRFVVYGCVSVEAYYQECLALCEQLHLQDTFLFAGHTSSAHEVYQRADVVALTSISEGFPYAVIEAMMSSTPVVATDVGGVSEALGDAGVLVTAGDAEAFAAALLALLQDAERRHTLGRTARRRALHFFTRDNMIEQYRYTYFELDGQETARLAFAPLPAQTERLDRQYPTGEVNDVLRQQAVERLLEQLRARHIYLHDRYEVAVLLETMGWNDARAAATFGVEDVFDLAVELLTNVALQGVDVRRAKSYSLNRSTKVPDASEEALLLDSISQIVDAACYACYRRDEQQRFVLKAVRYCPSIMGELTVSYSGILPYEKGVDQPPCICRYKPFERV